MLGKEQNSITDLKSAPKGVYLLLCFGFKTVICVVSLYCTTMLFNLFKSCLQLTQSHEWPCSSCKVPEGQDWHCQCRGVRPLEASSGEASSSMPSPTQLLWWELGPIITELFLYSVCQGKLPHSQLILVSLMTSLESAWDTFGSLKRYLSSELLQPHSWKTVKYREIPTYSYTEQSRKGHIWPSLHPGP